MRRTISRTVLATVLATALVLGLAACGDDDSEDAGGTTSLADDSSGGVNRLAVEALDSLKFDSDDYAANAGEVEFVYTNDGSLEHTLVIEGIDEGDFKLAVTGRGDVDEGAVELEAGEYTIFCDVSGHQAAGMEATLEVS